MHTPHLLRICSHSLLLSPLSTAEQSLRCGGARARAAVPQVAIPSKAVAPQIWWILGVVRAHCGERPPVAQVYAWLRHRRRLMRHAAELLQRPVDAVRADGAARTAARKLRRHQQQPSPAAASSSASAQLPGKARRSPHKPLEAESDHEVREIRVIQRTEVGCSLCSGVAQS